MADMIFNSPNGLCIVFDDFVDNVEEFDTYWVNMCPCCHGKYRSILGERASSGGSGEAPCSVKGCENNADYYVDFSSGEVAFND